MLSEVLSRAVRIRQILLEEPGYILARVEVKGGTCYAEAAPAGSVNQLLAWPSVQGLVRPVADRKTESGHRMVIFRDTIGRCLLEEIPSGGLQVRKVLDVVISVAGILRNLHLKGVVLGYIGPESVFTAPDGSISVTAGLRGVPAGHFSAPESVDSRPMDPRSDIFALGTFLTRLLAGSDEHEPIIRAWNEMDPGLRSLVEKMVSEDPGKRPANVSEMLAGLRDISTDAPPPVGPSEQPGIQTVEAPPAPRSERRRRKGLLPIVIIAVLALLAAGYVLFAPGPGEERDAGTPPEEIITTPDTSVSTPPDTLSADPPPVAGASVQETVLWISNCTGTSGSASAFREGPARDYPHAYPSTGARRASSVLLLRRSEIGLGLRQQPAWPLAESLAAADTSMVVLPVDVTILLGTDLSYPGVNGSALVEPSAPADTIFVDIVNQGLQYTLDETGPAAWMKALIDGRSVILAGIEYLISVVDTRDGDRSPNEETGLPSLLETTTFLYRTDSGLLPGFEGTIRQLLQAVPDEVAGPPDSIPIPDFWVLLGRS